MAQSGYTPISLYYSSTASAVPTAGNLVAGELAINTADGKLYYKDSGGTVQVIAGTGGSGVVAGSNTQIQFNNNGVFGASSSLTWNGSTLAVTGALTTTGNTTLGDSSTDTVTVNGYMGVGGAGDAGEGIRISSTALTGTTQTGLRVSFTGTSAATSIIREITTIPITAASAFTVSNVYGYYAQDAIKGAGSTITNQTGVYVADQTQGTTNYGITSAVSSGTNKWNIYASGTASNYFAGRLQVTGAVGTPSSNAHYGYGSTSGATIAGVGSTYDLQLQNSLNQNVLGIPTGTRNVEITGNTTLGDASTDTVTVNGYMGVGAAANAAYGLYVQSNALSGTSQYGSRFAITGTAGATGAVYGVMSSPTTFAGVQTTTDVVSFYATNTTKGAGSTITNRYGLYIEDLSQGTNNYGIISTVSSGTNKWNIYASGTAQNYFAGNVFIGSGATTSTDALETGTSTSNGVLHRFTNSATGYGAGNGLAIGIDASENAIFSNSEATNMIFYTSASERLRIDSSGNLGLGVTPSAWAGSYKVFQINNAAIWGNPANSTIRFTANTYFNGTNYVYSTTGYASAYVQDSTGIHSWQIAPSGTAGNTFSFTQAMTLNASGNLGIGTSSPATKLVVSTTGDSYETIRIGDAATLGSKTGLYLRSSTEGAISTASILTFYTGGAGNTERARIDSSGNLLVGSPTYTRRLSVKDTTNTVVVIEGSNAGSSNINFADSDSENPGSINYSHASNYMAFQTAGSERARIDSSGNVGIGTSSPAYKLDVNGDASIYGVRVGRGAGAVASNTVVGASALNSNTTGTSITAVGKQALYSNTASDNDAFGLETLYANTTGTNNAGFGQYSLRANTTGSNNSGFGLYSLRLNTTGGNNTALGTQALYSNTTASNNVAIGYQAGYSNSTSASNTFIGHTAGYSTTSTRNVFVGQGSGYWVSSGAKNVILGNFDGNQGGLDIRTSSNYIVLSDGDGNPRGIFDSSGNLLVGMTTGIVGGARISVQPASSGGVAIETNSTATYYPMWFQSSGVQKGYISTTSTGTSYNTTSDYRLKENVAPMTGALAKVSALKPCTYKWKSDGSDGDGFIAHELAEVCPQAVTGEKDAVDNEGNPLYQGVDTSFLVATLTAAIQELKAEFDAYKATHP